MRNRGFMTAGIRFGSAAVCSIAFAGAGCARHHRTAAAPASMPTKESITPSAVRLSKAPYWFRQPAVAAAASPDYDRLWQACLDVAREDGFIVDRTDYREGLITTRPRVSKQFFEAWRDDAGTVKDVADSSLNSTRRTIRIELARDDDGVYVARPKVVIERFYSAGRRLTSASQYRSAFSSPGPNAGSAAEDQGVKLPQRYWYATGRDQAMEQRLAEKLKGKLGQR